MSNPTEVWPSDATIDALDGTTDGNTGLPYVAKGTKPSSSPSLERQYNRRQHRAHAILATAGAGRVVKVDDTHIGIFSAYYRIGVNDYNYAGEASVEVPANDTYYAYLTAAAGISLVIDATGWPADPYSYIPLAEVTRAAGAITTIVDVRTRSKLCTPPPTMKAGGTTVAADVLVIPITAAYVAKTTGIDAEVLSLANGEPGQVLTIVLTVDGGGDGGLAPTTKSGFATIQFADAGDTATLQYVDDTVGWIIAGTAGVAAPPLITV